MNLISNATATWKTIADGSTAALLARTWSLLSTGFAAQNSTAGVGAQNQLGTDILQLTTRLSQSGGSLQPQLSTTASTLYDASGAAKTIDTSANDVSKSLFQALDRNGNNFISSNEFGIPPNVFTDADKNGDGKLSISEFIDALQKIVQKSNASSSGNATGNSVSIAA